jgi:hypothetical protein
MGIPQVSEQVRRSPIVALRAVFTGIGRIVMSVSPASPAPGPTEPSSGPQPPAQEQTALPLPNYDALSLASIRARLRGLDVAQLKVLLDYEAVNAERTDVLGMLERRIEKLEAGG